jgi:hypothetical protein
MVRRVGLIAAIPAAVLGVVLLAGQAQAAVIWTGDASAGTAVFGNNNCDRPGSVIVVTDPAQGKVWRFNKPKGDLRCEEHGIAVKGKRYTFTNNATYYFNWSMNLSNLADNNANFQWKSYGSHFTQNFPIVIKMRGGKLTLMNRQPNNQTFYPWAAAIKVNTWHRIVLGIHTSDALKGGWVEFYFDGVQQRFTDGTTRWAARTWDTRNEPKWGVYGAQNTAVVNLVSGLKMGTSLADVAG